ncbi:MAG TPA: ATP-binding protein [Nitrospiraceae bacterium]|nr:ATP-binding protein [Nitrospiraceae bacterium]
MGQFRYRITHSHEPVSINGVIRSALSLMEEHLRLHNIRVTLDLSESDPSVLGSSIHLEQVMINLLTNARDAVKDAARKQIHVASALSHPCVALTVADTGTGILPHAIPHIFDPFFTTKPVGEGTGWGSLLPTASFKNIAASSRWRADLMKARHSAFSFT